MARIIAVANQKGGVGKTTTAVSLAACLAEPREQGGPGRRVLLVDCDPQGNATSGFGIDKGALEQSIYDVLIDQVPASQVLVHTEFAVDVLPANIQLAGAEVELVSAIARETRLRKALAEMEQEYDFIIIDCPPSLGLLTLNGLTAARTVLMPIQCEFYALEGVSQLMNTINLVRDGLNPELGIEGIVMTMYDSRTRLGADVVAKVRENFGDALYDTMIPRTVRLSEAPSYGQPIIYYESKSKGAEVYRQLAREVLKRGQ